jgi:hypothetical protein
LNSKSKIRECKISTHLALIHSGNKGDPITCVGKDPILVPITFCRSGRRKTKVINNKNVALNVVSSHL